MNLTLSFLEIESLCILHLLIGANSTKRQLFIFILTDCESLVKG